MDMNKPLNCSRSLFKLYHANGKMIAMLTARNEAAALEAYAADNKEAEPVERIDRVTWGYPCDMFSTWPA